MTEPFKVKSISGAKPDETCIQCDNCNQVVQLDESSKGLCLDCLYEEVKDLVQEDNFSKFEYLEVDELLDKVDTDCWEACFSFFYKDVMFFCDGMATGCESIGYSVESLDSACLCIGG